MQVVWFVFYGDVGLFHACGKTMGKVQCIIPRLRVFLAFSLSGVHLAYTSFTLEARDQATVAQPVEMAVSLSFPVILSPPPPTPTLLLYFSKYAYWEDCISLFSVHADVSACSITKAGYETGPNGCIATTLE